MGTTSDVAAFDRGIRPLLRLILLDKAQEVLSFRPPAALEGRIEYLAERSTEGQLTASERAEYEGYVRANKFVAVLRRQARRLVEEP